MITQLWNITVFFDPYIRQGFWLALGLFIIFEFLALHNKVPDDTFSQRVWALQNHETYGKIVTWHIFAFTQWISWHFLLHGRV